jgi:hypothetical protein
MHIDRKGSPMFRHVIIAAAALGLIVLPTNAAAQRAMNTMPAVLFSGGLSQYDLQGVGTSGVVAVRAQLPVTRRLVSEAAIVYMAFDNQFGPRTRQFMPEAQLQADLLTGGVRPYLGVGAGLSHARLAGFSTTELTVSTAGGMRVDLGSRWIAAGELRIRAIDPWAGSTADWTVSVGHRF